jgi:hypothetical protein
MPKKRKKNAETPLKRHIINYDKGAKVDFPDTTIIKARENAEKLNNQTKLVANPKWNSPYQWNPYTNVYEILDSIDEVMEGETNGS